MTRTYPRTTDFLTRARAVTPGATQTRSKGIGYLVEGASPAFLTRGRGARVWDVDGHEYVDWSLSLGAIGLGYCHPAVDEAVIRQVRDGASFSLAHPLETEVAERLCEIIPCAERVRFVKTGSEATEAAMRIARVATGRDVIISIGYHGWHSAHDAAVPQHPGVPHGFTKAIVDVPYNDLDALERAFESQNWVMQGSPPPHPTGAVAAVLIEPVLHDEPATGYLQGVRNLCDDYGALLIFDEVVSGFRWALGGAQEFFGVTPDLACFGKALANGYPLGAVVGRRDVMERGAWFVSSTFGGEAVSLAAAKATIDVYRGGGRVIERMWTTGQHLIDRVNDTARVWSGALPFRAVGYPCKPRLVITYPIRDTLPGYRGADEQKHLLMSILIQELCARGVLIHPRTLCVSAAHGEAELRDTAAAVSAACQTMLEALSNGDLAQCVRGIAYQEGFKR